MPTAKLVFFALVAVLLSACTAPTIEGGRRRTQTERAQTERTRQEPDADEEAETSPVGEVADEEVDATDPELTTLVSTPNGTSAIPYVERDGMQIAFDDIALPDTFGPGVATAVGQVKLWPNGVVPYVVSTGSRAAFEAGIALWAAKTNAIRFVPRTNQTDYVDVVRGNGCLSFIGRVGGRQELSLGEGCDVDHVAAHEIGHAIGLWHEHSRADRDQFVTVNLANAEEAKRFAFRKVTFKSIGAFDYTSVMLYPSEAFSTNGRPTILRRDGGSIPWNVDVSRGDASGVNALYGKTGGGTPPPPPPPEKETETETDIATTTANLNLRVGPGTSYGILLTIPKGSSVELTGNTAGSWARVSFDGALGWAHSAYLR